MAVPRAAEIAARVPEQPSLQELRARHGTGADDDLLILKALIPESDIDAMRAAGPPRRDYPLAGSDLDEVRTLMETVRTPYVRVSTERWDLELRR
jgi:oxaloacetate decarboxylase alpha subunit